MENRGRSTPWDLRFMPACYAGVGVPAGFDVRVYAWQTILNALFTYCGEKKRKTDILLSYHLKKPERFVHI